MEVVTADDSSFLLDSDDVDDLYTAHQAVCVNCDYMWPAGECFPCSTCGESLCQSCVDAQTPPLICMECLSRGIKKL